MRSAAGAVGVGARRTTVTEGETGLRIRLLGPLDVLSEDGRPNTVSAPMLRALLAALALRPGRVLPAAELVHGLWGEEPPPTARTTLRNYVMRLRKALPEDRIRTAAGGYQLLVTEAETDVGRVRELLRDSRALTTAAPAEALALLEEALALWRGTPLEDIGDCPLRGAEQSRLGELHLTAVEERFELKTALGRHGEIIDELTAAVRGHPLRERLARQLMLALHRSGRTADALAVYRAVRERLIDQLGLEPGLELRQLEAAILRDDPALLLRPPSAAPAGAGTGPPRPATPVMPGFPAVPGTFVARDRELALLKEWLAATAGPPVCLVDGPGGVGKSTLAVRAARETADRFPDGLLYVDLRGADPRNPALEPEAALGTLLTALGVPRRERPQELAAAVARYRERLRGRRVLVLLDNALDADQVRPLLPDEPGCAALVTSRAMLTGLTDGRHLHLPRLETADAVRLLRTAVGTAPDGDDEHGWEELSRLCGQLPLALRIVATRMAARPRWSVRDWISVLRQEHGRMDLLRVADLDLRASLMVSIEQLAAGADPVSLRAAALFPRLGVAAIRGYRPESAAALAHCTPAEAEEALERLTDARITDSPRPGHYSLHDLLRSAAEWQAARLPAAERRAALAALAGYYLGTLYRLPRAVTVHTVYRDRAREAAERFPDGAVLTGAEEVLHWIDEAVDDVLSLAEQLAAPEYDAGGELAGDPLAAFAHHAALALEPYFGLRLNWRHQQRLCALALEVSVRSADRFGEASALSQLGKAAAQRGEIAEGERRLRRAVELFTELGRDEDRLRSVSNLSGCLAYSGRLADAVRMISDAVAEARRLGLRDGLVMLLANLAWCTIQLGELERARDAALESYRLAVLPYSRTMACGLLAEYHLKREQPEEAARWAERGLAHAEEQPLDDYAVAHLRSLLSEALRSSGLGAAAEVQARQAQEAVNALNRREHSNLQLRPPGRPAGAAEAGRHGGLPAPPAPSAGRTGAPADESPAPPAPPADRSAGPPGPSGAAAARTGHRPLRS